MSTEMRPELANLYRQDVPFLGDDESMTSVWLYAVQHAVTLRDMSRYAKAGSNDRSLPTTQRTIAWRSWMEYRSHIFHMMAPFRHGFKARNARELSDAVRRVHEYDARFYVGPLNMQGCASCDRPLWQHILLDHAKLCPSDGRSYWVLARAILAMDGLNADLVRRALAPIARKK